MILVRNLLLRNLHVICIEPDVIESFVIACRVRRYSGINAKDVVAIANILGRGNRHRLGRCRAFGCLYIFHIGLATG